MHVTPHWPTRPQRKLWMPHCLGRGILPARNLASLAGADSLFAGAARDKLEQLHAELLPLSERYDVVVANPPYMGSNNMNKWLAGWTKNTYPDSKRDLCTCFIERGQNLAVGHGYEALITSDTCMYISSFEQLRKNILSRSTIVGFIDTRGTNAHPDVFDANAGWVLHNAFVEGVKGTYFKLNQAIAAKEAGYLEALANPECGWVYRANPSVYKDIPGSPIVYWASSAIQNAFIKGTPLAKIAEPHVGLQTGENNRFLRLWWEVEVQNCQFHCSSLNDSVQSGAKWFPYNKGGEYRKWYGNNDFVVNYRNNGEDIFSRENADKHHVQPISPGFEFLASVTWSKISSGNIAFRYKPEGHLFDIAGTSIFSTYENLCYLQGVCNSSVILKIACMLSPTLNFEVGQIATYPIINSADRQDDVCALVEANRKLAKAEWDDFEASWDFRRHPLL